MHRNVHLASENDERTAEVSGVWEPPSCTSWGVLRGRWGDTPGISHRTVTAAAHQSPGARGGLGGGGRGEQRLGVTRGSGAGGRCLRQETRQPAGSARL